MTGVLRPAVVAVLSAAGGCAKDAPPTAVAVARIAPRDAAPVLPVDATLDASVDARPSDVVFTKEVPEFGCLGWSRARSLVACVVGERTDDGGRIDLVFAALRAGVEVPDAITVLDAAYLGASLELPQATVDRLTAALRGFEPLDRAPQLHADYKHMVAPPIVVGGLALAARLAEDGTGTFATKYHYILVGQRGRKTTITLDDFSNTIDRLDVRAFAIGDRVIVDRSYHIGDEGTYGTFGAAWLCNAYDCKPVE